MLDPARLDRYSTPDRAFQEAQRSRDAVASIRWAAFDRRLHQGGAEDRMTLGIITPVLARPVTQGHVFGAMSAAFQNAFEQFARDFSEGFRLVRGTQR
jgi:hypothetical protein